MNDGAVDVTDNQDGTYSFTTPDGDVTVSAEFVELELVTSIDEKGAEKTVNAIPLDGTESFNPYSSLVELASGGLCCGPYLNYSRGLDFTAPNTVLILKNNAKLNILGNMKGVNFKNLYIYGQSAGTGEFNVESSEYVFESYYNLYLYGGNIIANSSYKAGIKIGNIYHDGAEVSSDKYKGDAQVRDGLIYGDEDANIYTGTLTDEQIAAFANKTHAPVKPQWLSSGIASQPVLHIVNSDNILAVQNTLLDGYKFDGFTVNGEKCENMAAVVSAVRTLREGNPTAQITITHVFLQNDDTYALSIKNDHINGSDDTTGKF